MSTKLLSMSTLHKPDEIRELLPPEHLLSRLGYEPLFIQGGYELVYKSMLRHDRKSSLRLDTRLGLWYDRSGENPSGVRKGDVIDLGKALFHPISHNDLLTKLSGFINSNHKISRRQRKAKRLPHYRFAEDKPLGFNAEITHFLRSQGLWELSLGQMKEVYYYVIDEKRQRKDFFGAGWQNENGGWQVRAKNFSGCIGPCGMTFLPNDPNRLIMFLDYTDYLSWRYAFRNDQRSVLILNSLDFVPAARHRASRFPDAVFFTGPNEKIANVSSALNSSGTEDIRLVNFTNYGQVH